MYSDTELFYSQDYTDVTFKLYDGEIKAHSTYLRKLTFFDKSLKLPDEKIFFFDFSKKAMDAVLEIIYKNKINLYMHKDFDLEYLEVMYHEDEILFLGMDIIMEIYEIAERITFNSLIIFISDHLNIRTIDELLIVLNHENHLNIKNIINNYFFLNILKIDEMKKIIKNSLKEKYIKCTILIKDESVETLESIFIDLHDKFFKINIYYVCTNVTGLFSKMNIFYKYKSFIGNYQELIKIILSINIDAHLIDEIIFEKFDDKTFTEQIKIIFEIQKLKNKYLIFKSKFSELDNNFNNVPNEFIFSNDFEIFRSNGYFYNVIDKNNNLNVHDDIHVRNIFEKISCSDKEIYFKTDINIKLNEGIILTTFEHANKLSSEKAKIINKQFSVKINEICFDVLTNIDLLKQENYTDITINIINFTKFDNKYVKYIQAHKQILIKLEYFNKLFKYSNGVYFYGFDEYVINKVIECLYSENIKCILDGIENRDLLKIYKFSNYICYDKVCDYISQVIIIYDELDLELVAQYNDISNDFSLQINNYVMKNGFGNLRILLKYFLNTNNYKKMIDVNKSSIVKWIINTQNNEINFSYVLHIANKIFGYDEKIFYNCINYFKKEKHIYKSLKYDEQKNIKDDPIKNYYKTIRYIPRGIGLSAIEGELVLKKYNRRIRIYDFLNHTHEYYL